MAPGAPPSALRAWAGWGLRLGITGLLLWLTLRRVPLPGIKAALLQVRPWLAALSVATFLAGSFLLEPIRLALAGHLLEERNPGAWAWVRIFIESRPFYYLLPGALASEGVIWMRLRRLDWRHASCGFVLMSTRVWGVAAWGLLAATSLAIPGGGGAILAQAPPLLRSPALWAGGGMLAVCTALLAPHLAGRFRHLSLRPRTGLTNASLGLLAGGSALVVGFSVFLASRAAGTPLPFHAALGLMAFFNFAMVLPVSLGGFGLQEAMVLLLGTPLGFDPPALIAFSALIHLQRLVLSLVGLGGFLAER